MPHHSKYSVRRGSNRVRTASEAHHKFGGRSDVPVDEHVQALGLKRGRHLQVDDPVGQQQQDQRQRHAQPLDVVDGGVVERAAVADLGPVDERQRTAGHYNVQSLITQIPIHLS